MIKVNLKNYWVLITLVIVANILIFTFFSHHLESFVTTYTVEQMQAKNGF